MKPIIKVDDVAFPTLQVPDLAEQEKFLIDFGMQRAALTDDTLYMHGAGPQAFVHASKLGPKKFLSRFMPKQRTPCTELHQNYSPIRHI